MKKQLFKLLICAAVIVGLASCTTLHQTMREPNTRVNLTKSDFSLSDQVAGEAKTVRIFGIDWNRLFITQKTATISEGSSSISMASIPVIGSLWVDKDTNYALYEMMSKNPGYDVVFYPQYETTVYKPVLGIGFIAKITTVKAVARLGKLNK